MGAVVVGHAQVIVAVDADADDLVAAVRLDVKVQPDAIRAAVRSAATE
jgi:hypothetical protein